MACRVPGCSSRYWNKNNKHTLFRASSAKQLADWREILSLKGVDDFGANDQVCILHFKEEYIERERIIYQSDGTVSKKPRKVLLLTHTAVPTIFPSEIPRTERKKRQKPGKHLDYAVTIDSETFAKHREEVRKRKLPSDDDVSRDDLKSAKQMKTNNLFQSIVNAIHKQEKVSPHLNGLWTANVWDNKCIRWSLWKVDRSGEEKGINLYEDLKVEVFVNGRKILLPNMDSVVQMCDLQNLFKKVSHILPCKVADYETKESNACLGFIVKNVGRPKVWCTPCSKYQTNLKRRMAPQVKTRALKNAVQSLQVRCNKLRHRNEILKIEKGIR